ncbi:MAG: methyltransferase domain-containing protein, partial [Defluviitaleaceae bacterium]|nr:methyltransferase domain-containing protein [Defluviitaleaceae bacterium]
NWDMDFICDDAVTLSKIESDKYDFVYIPNGVMFWINDLQTMYASIWRVLKNNGIYMMYDMHPFMPPFEFDNTEKLVFKKDYDAVGPFGDMEVYNWRLQDFLNSMVSAGLNFVHMEEMKAAYGTFWVDEDKADDMPKDELARFYDSKTNPMYALPQCLSIVARKA